MQPELDTWMLLLRTSARKRNCLSGLLAIPAAYLAFFYLENVEPAVESILAFIEDPETFWDRREKWYADTDSEAA